MPVDKSLRHFSRYGCTLCIYLPIAKATIEVSTHPFICAYSLHHLVQFSQYGPKFFPRRFITVVPSFYFIEDVDPYNYTDEDRKFTCRNHSDICKILMRNVIVALSIDASNYHLNIDKL